MVNKIEFTEDFDEQYRSRIMKRVRKLFDAQFALFKKNPHDPRLNRHALDHQWSGYESFNVNDDYRVIFKEKRDKYVLVAFGNHDQLYRPWKRGKK
jgi:mRNA-degrading endonuclease YafQ of YafQ-DinJ toxin-antitoxin module